MKWHVISIKDRALDAYGRPFVVPSLGVAVRAFQDMVSGGDAEISKHPDDYDLYQLGEFDDAIGQFRNLEVPGQLASGKQIVLAKGS